MTTRRGFFRSILGAGAVVAGVDIGKSGGSSTAFNFTCSCGRGIIAHVPEQEGGDPVNISCECGIDWELEWAGDRFKTRIANRKVEEEGPSIEDRIRMAGESLEWGPHDLG